MIPEAEYKIVVFLVLSGAAFWFVVAVRIIGWVTGLL